MATSYTSLLGLALPVQGELSGTWGDTVNNYITTYLDSSIAGSVTVTADTTLTKTTNASLGATSSQYAVIIASPASANITITAPAASKIYTIINTSATYTVKIVGAGPTTGVTLGVSEKAQVAWNGSDFIKVASSSISNLTGTLPVANGGTGLTSGTSGGVLYYSAAGTIASSAALAANALVVGGGAGATPATITTGTGVTTALGVNTGSAGAFVVNGGALGTPSSGTLTNATGLPISTGVSGLGTGVATFLGTPSSANLAAAVTDETGSGSLVFATSPTLVTPILGTPTSGTLTNCTFPTLNQNTTGTAAGLSATLVVGSGGTGQTTYTDGQLLIGNTTGNTLTKSTLTAGSGVTITNGGGSITIAATGSGGTVTGVTATSPVASSGGAAPVISLDAGYGDTLNPYASKTANYVLAAPNGSAGVPTFRALVAADIPALSYVATGTANTFTAAQTFSGSSSVLASVFTNMAEVATVSATAATGTINYDITTQSVLYYTSNASANWTVNFRASSGTSLNTAMATGQSLTAAFLVTQGSTAYYNSAVQIDGSSVTPKWQGGTAPSAGNASSVDVYTYTIVKTGAAAFTVFASQTKFA